ncbi:response regulator [Lachnospiraceae bacterium 47-T17]
MYKLLIVDDEPLVQVGIKSMLDWSTLDVEITGTAANGEAALKLIEQQLPDIVITDIKMPILSGLELVRICRERYGSLPAFLILTSYEDFAMAKQAISYQVTDYLVKLELDASMLETSVRRAIALINKSKAPTVKGRTDFSHAGALRERFFIRLVNNLFESEEQFLLQKEELSISFPPEGCLAGYFLIDPPPDTNMDSGQLLNLYSSALEMFIQLIAKYIACYVTPLDARHFLAVFPFAGEEADEARPELIHALENTRGMLKNYYNATIRAGLGHPVSNPFDLSSSFYEAKQSLAGTDADTPFLFFDGLDRNAAGSVFNMAIFKNDIRAAYEEMNHEKLRGIFASITELFSQHTSHYLQAMDAAGSILYLTISLLPEGEHIVSDIFSEDAAGYRSLYQLGTTEQVMNWMQTLCDGLCAYFLSEKEDYKNHVVANVKSYINQNLNQKLTLNEVAAAFGISPGYLSSLFGKYSDMGFVACVNHAKINAAKKMLRESNDKIYEIAEKLGFESAFYFSKVFKKVEGCSPREFVQKG